MFSSWLDGSDALVKVFLLRHKGGFSWEEREAVCKDWRTTAEERLVEHGSHDRRVTEQPHYHLTSLVLQFLKNDPLFLLIHSFECDPAVLTQLLLVSTDKTLY